MRENRKMERFGLCLQATIAKAERQPSGAREIVASTRNISSGGAFFSTCDPFPVGTQVQVHLLMGLATRISQISPRPLLKVTGTVVRNDPDGMAVCFRNNHRFCSMPISPVSRLSLRPMAEARC